MNAGQGGSIYVVLGVPNPWPPPAETLLFSSSVEAGSIEVTVDTLGRISYTVSQGQAASNWSYTSQPVSIEGAGIACLRCVWGAKRQSVAINEVYLSRDGSSVPTAKIVLHAPELGPCSIVHPQATVVCNYWIQKRRSKFEKSKRLRAGRRAKSIAEASRDLERSAACLRDLAEWIRSGKNHLIGSLVAELRAVLYWSNDASPETGYNCSVSTLCQKHDVVSEDAEQQFVFSSEGGTGSHR